MSNQPNNNNNSGAMNAMQNNNNANSNNSTSSASAANTSGPSTSGSAESSAPASRFHGFTPTTPSQVSLDAALRSAVHDLSHLGRNDITSLKRMKHAPVPVQKALEATAIVMGVKPVHAPGNRSLVRTDYWTPAQALLSRANFFELLLKHTGTVRCGCGCVWVCGVRLECVRSVCV